MAKKKKKTKKKVVSPEAKKQAKIQRLHIKDIRSIFSSSGFSRVLNATNKEFAFEGTTTDIDDLFIYKNVLVLLEYTTTKDDISGHLKKKKVAYDKITANQSEFVEFLDTLIPGFTAQRGEYFAPHHYKVVVVYCSLNPVAKDLKKEVTSVRYLDYHIARYFGAVSSVIRQSARFEVLRFLGLEHADIGENVVSPGTAESTNYEGSILPEGHSNFGKGYKVISFYVDPDALLRRCYVLRKDGWEDRGQLYQRMISKKKIEAIRRYLLDQKRVFINNIIVTLPSDTKLLDSKGNTQDISKLLKTAPVKIQLPSNYNSIGLIDGQHRVFSYYEGGAHEADIEKLRRQQNLLVTGIIYPPSITALDKTKFEATLFLEINSTQTNAKSDLKQAIGLLLHPFSAESIAKQVVNLLNDDHGPLLNEFQRYFFDKDKLKTTSVVSYGVRPIVKLQGEDSLFKAWTNPKKGTLNSETNLDLLEEYVEFCAKEIGLFISAVKVCLPKDKWTADKKVKGRLLTTTNINGWVICLRKIIELDKVHAFEYYKGKLAELSKFDFSKYRSSQYGRMAEDMYAKYFEK